MSDHIVGIDEVGRLFGWERSCMCIRSDDKFFQSLPFEVIDSKISQKKEMIYDFFTSINH